MLSIFSILLSAQNSPLVQFAPADLFKLQFFDLLFVVSAVLFNLLVIGVYLAQKRERTDMVKKLGGALVLLALPFTATAIYFFIAGRESWVVIFSAVILLYLLVEFLLDMVFKIDFRSKAVLHIPYILLFYAALGGLIGISFSISQVWGYIVSVTFWALLASLIYLFAGRKKRSDTKPAASL